MKYDSTISDIDYGNDLCLCYSDVVLKLKFRTCLKNQDNTDLLFNIEATHKIPISPNEVTEQHSRNRKILCDNISRIKILNYSVNQRKNTGHRALLSLQFIRASKFFLKNNFLIKTNPKWKFASLLKLL